MTSWILYYNSSSHKKTRYFVGSETKSMKGMSPLGVVQINIEKPTWTDDKDAATIFDEKAQGEQAKKYCESAGYKGLVLEPIDEQTLPAKKIEEDVT